MLRRFVRISNRFFVQPVNYERGTVLGSEFEVREPLDWVADWLRGVAIGANLSLIDSEVEVPAAEQGSLASFGLDTETRRLQGQPEFLFNAYINFDLPKTGTSGGLFYNRTGAILETGAARGEDGTPSVFSREIESIDLSVRQSLFTFRRGGGFALVLRAKNLSQPADGSYYELPDGEQLIKERFPTARRYSASLSWSW